MPDRERGSTLPMTLVMAAIAVLLALTVAAATDLHLARTRLHAIVDATALAATEAIDVERSGPLEPGAAPTIVLDPDRVRARAEAYLAAHPDGGEVRLITAEAVGGDAVAVVVEREWHSPFGIGPVRRTVDVRAEGAARLALRT